jgi:SSS family solute:Na+ symporter
MEQQMMSLWLLWTGLILFILTMIVIGLVARRYAKATLEDFFLGGRRLGVVLAFFTTYATLFSAFSYFGVTGAYYTHGIGVYGWCADIALLSLLIYIFGSRLRAWGRKFGYICIGDMLADRYQSKALAALASIVFVIAIVPYVGAQLRGSGVLLEGFSRQAIPYWVGVAFMSTIIAVYVSFGGFRGVVWTDFIQGVVMMAVLSVAMVIIVYKAAGGFGPLMTKIASQKPELLSLPGPKGVYNLRLTSSIIIMFGLCNFTLPWMVQRYYALKSARTLKYLAVIFTIGTMFIFIPNYYIAMAGRVHFPNLARPETVYPMLISAMVPSGIALVALIGMLAATGSTANSLVLTCSSILVNDLYLTCFSHVRDISQKVVTNASRALISLVIVAAILVAFFGPPSIVGLILNVAWPLMFQVFPTIAAALFWKRATPTACIISILVGEAVVLAIRLKWMPALFGLHMGLVGGIFAAITLIIVSLLTRPLPDEHVRKFFELFERRPQVSS